MEELKTSKQNEHDHLFKVLLIGDIAVGKSSIFNRYGKSTYEGDYKSTIGVDFLSIITHDVPGIKNKKIMVQLWDTAGQEKFRTITRTYFKGAHGAIIVYDITNRTSYNNVHNWVQDTDKHSPLGIAKLLIGNKSDDDANRKVTFDEGKELADVYKMQFIETSAKSNTNIKETFNTLIKMMYDTETQVGAGMRKSISGSSKGTKLKDTKDKKKSKKK